MASNMREFGEQVDEIRNSPEFKAWHTKASSDRISYGVDSFIMDLQPGNTSTSSLSTGVIASTTWSVDDVSGFYGSLPKCRAIHEKHGATDKTWNIIGGRYAGSMSYNANFPTMSAFGDSWENSREEINKENVQLIASGSRFASVLSEIILDNSVIVG